MAFAAFETDLPELHAAEFVNGEKAVVTADPPGDATLGPWFFARFANWEPGVYNLKIISSGDAILRIGPSIGAMQQVMTLIAGVVHRTQIYIPPGPQRIDLVVDHPVERLGVLCGFAMLVYLQDRVVYASRSDGWVVDWVGYPSDLQTPPAADPAALMPVFSVLPNWKDGVTEQIQYRTDVLVSETGMEQTRALRERPRRTFEAEFLRAWDIRQRLDMFLVGIGRQYFLLPLWHEQFRPVGGLSSGVVTVQFPVGTLALREFAIGDSVFVNDRNPNDYEILIVAAIDTTLDQLTFEVGPSKDWPDGTRIAPLRRARITEKSEIRHPTDGAGATRIRFDLGDYVEWFDANWGTNPPRFKFAADRAEDVNADFDRVVFWQDNEVGEPYSIDPGDAAFVGVRASVLLRGRDEILRFRKFVAAARGRARRFFMPSYTHDLIPVGGSGTTLVVKSFGYTQYADRLHEARKTILVEFRDGTADMLVTIVDITSDGVTDVLSLDVALPNLTTGRVKRIQFLIPSRFDQDSFELKHYVDDAVAVRTSVVTKTVIGLPMVASELFVTTPVYPLEDVNELEGDLLLESGVLQAGLLVEEEIEGDLDLDSGSLREPIVNIFPLEELDGELELESGTLRQILLQTTLDPEEVEGDIELESGTIRTIVVKIEMDVDSLDGNLTLEGGNFDEY